MIAGLRSLTLSGHPDDAVRFLRLSERLRNLAPRLLSSEAFFSSDFRLSHSNETPITIPVKKTNANLNQRCWPSARRFSKTVVATALRKTVVAISLGSEKTFSSNHFLRIGVISGISRRPQIPNRSCLSHLDMGSYCFIRPIPPHRPGAAPGIAVPHMPWLANTFWQPLLSLVRFCCKHC